jgi:hypothetical protein
MVLPGVVDNMENTIPPITHPLGKSWQQPSPQDILIDDTHALMSQETFKALAEYSCSTPTGVYEGKMWKRRDGAFDKEFLAGGGKPIWLLCWFSLSETPNMCSTNSRKIIIV